MGRSSTRWRLSPVAWLPIGLSIGAESISNGLRAYKLGAHLPGLTVDIGFPLSLAGAVLVMAAVAISICQARAAFVACSPGDTFQRVVAAGFAVLFLTISITALHSHIADAERAKNGDETTEKATYDRATTAYKAAEADYKKVKDADTPEGVQARMDAIEINATIRARTKNCTDITTRASQDECAPVVKLKPELAAAQRKAELEARLPVLKASLDGLQNPELASGSDVAVSGFWGWLMGLGVVGIATFGAVLFAKVEAVQDYSEIVPIPKSVPRTPPRGGRRLDPKVVNFTTAFRKQHGRRPTGSEIKAYFPELATSTAYDYAKRTVS